MKYHVAKLLLEKADTFLSRVEAIKQATKLGMPLQEIEEYLDWLDLMRGRDGTNGHPSNAQSDPAGEPDESHDRWPPTSLEGDRP